MLKEELILRNRLKQARTAMHLSQTQLAELVGVSRNTISSIETGQFNPTAKLALILCIALEQKFEDLFYFDEALYCLYFFKSKVTEAFPQYFVSRFYSMVGKLKTGRLPYY